MIIDCHSCGATYNVADEKIRGRRVRVRCKACGTGIIVDGRELHPDDATRQLSPEDATRQVAAAFDDEEDETQVIRASHLRADRKSAPPPRAAPPADQTQPDPPAWTIADGAGEPRVLSTEAIAEGVNNGLIAEDAYVWQEGMEDWVPLTEVPDIRAAIEAGEKTRVADARSLRSGPAAAPSPSPVAALPLQSAPAAAPSPSRVVAPPLRNGPAATPSAPPLKSEPAPNTTAAYAPPARPPRSAARLQASPSRPDLFAGSERVGSEDELLASSASASLGPTGPRIGARNETSVLFSLNALKATASAPAPSPVPSRPSVPSGPTAADLLGFSGQASAPSFSANAALATAPVVAPAPVPAAAETESASYRARMDTTPPAYRRRVSPLLIIGAAALLASALFVGTLVVRGRQKGEPPAPPQTAEPAEPAAVQPVAAPKASAPVQAREEEETPAGREDAPEPEAEKSAPASAAPSPPARPASKPHRAAKVEPPPGPAPPKTAAPEKPEPEPEPAPEPARTPSLSEALESAIGGSVKKEKDPPKTSPELESAIGEAGKPVPKVVLEEDSEAKSAESALPPFNTAAAKSALASAAAAAASCKQPDGPTGGGKAQVTFATSGRATSANIVSGPFGGTPVGGCIARQFRGATVPPFSGSPVTVAKSFRIPD